MESLFSVAGLLAMAGWLGLVITPLAPHWVDRISGYAIPALLSLGYTILIITYWGAGEGGFGSLAEVASLFQTPGLLLAGWVHYLVFDLFIGGWIVRDARVRGIRHWFTLPFLPLTFLFGPVGLLGWLGLRLVAGANKAEGAVA